ncbi:MAG: complex I NDUFA9 subunit family protein [Gammaproteobacteria bacterium]|nr:complex I NDUFA9 subunit family protein [Gammaproteobacteria bacterium]MBI5618960.1 complex I NDUFA9 subunit family protein [Gammaproteobacteria bacterium]
MPLVAVLGGSGFLGGHLAAALAGSPWRVRVLTRRRGHAQSLWLLPHVDILEADVHDPGQLAAGLEGCGAVVNLIGILNERRDDGRGFRRAHVELATTLVAACRATGVRRLVQVSSLAAAPDAPSHYLRTKGQAEQVLRAADDLDVTILRPSVVFGPGDSFFNRFAGLLRLAPALPLAGADARFQPVYVGDVAAAIIRALDDPATSGHTYDLGGPETWTLREIVDYTAGLLGVTRLILPLGGALSRLQAELCEFVPGKPFSRDNLRSLGVPSVCGAHPGFDALDITPRSIRAIVPAYLGGRAERRRYDDLRRGARR